MTADRPEVRARVVDHLRSPLTRSGYALLLSSVITSVLGLGYWVLAARFYDEGDLGRGAALVSAMLLVTSLATAGLKRGLIRFVPTAGGRARRLIVRVYLVGLSASLVFALVLLTQFDSVEDRLTVLSAHPYAPVLFLLGVGTWGFFVLQDAVLIGAHRSTAVPASNAAFSVLKIVLLVVFAITLSRDWGVFMSWVVPAALTAVVVNIWLFRRGLDRIRPSTDEAPASVRQIVRFTSAEYVASLVWQSAIYMTPLLVLARAGAVANAHYYLPSQIAYGFYLVSSNVTDALVAEGAAAQSGLTEKVRRVIVQMALIMVPGIIAVVVGAPLLMRIFGSDYAGDSVVVLRLLVLSALPNAISTTVVAVSHVRRRLWVVVVLQTVMAALTLGLSWVLVGGNGIEGVATAWLVAQCVSAVLAVALLFKLERRLMRSTRAWLVGHASAARAVISQARAQRVVKAHLGIVPPGALPDGKVGLLAHQHDLLVLAAGSASVPMVVRVAVGSNGPRVVRSHRDALDLVHADARIPGIAAMVPDVLAMDDDARWLIESRVPGRPIGAIAGTVTPEAVSAGLALLARLHGATARQVIAGPQELDEWVHGPVATVARSLHDERSVLGLAALRRRLTDELLGCPVTVARLHGDPSFDNLLMDEAGTSVTGVVDWESSSVGLPEVDVIDLILSRRSVLWGQELGDQILDMLGNGWSTGEREVLGPAWSVNAHVRPTTLVLLAWLAHVSANLEKAERYGANRWWVHHNVEVVLRGLPEIQAADDQLEPISLAPDVAAAASADARAGEARDVHTEPLVPARLRVPIAAASVASWPAYALGAPMAIRVALVLAAVAVAPAAALGRRAASSRRDRLRRAVVGGAGAVALDVVVAEVLLYSGLWSPGRFLLVVCAVAFGLCVVRSGVPDPSERVAAASPPSDRTAVEPEVIDLRDSALSGRWSGPDGAS